MENTQRLKMAVIGVGVMGSQHLKDIHALEQAELVAVCDIDRAKADRFAAQYGAKAYYDYRELLEMPGLDAILIATPHYDHPIISIAAFQQGIHVLVEKPIAVHAKDARKMIAAYDAAKATKPDLVFAAMFMQRTYGHWQQIKRMIDEGELGKLVRTTWIITNWYRPQIYYDQGGWRATWGGEGGGVLLNQCPHNLDLYQWFVGLPSRVTAFAGIGKYHRIEVEDEVTAYLEYDNGMVGHFITTTAESPGTNRLEIVGEHGKLIFEDDKLTFYKNRMSMFEHTQIATGMFDKVECETLDVSYQHHGEPGHRFIIENFVKAIRAGEPLIAPAAEGLNSVMLGNAMLFSSFQQQTISLPFDEDGYERQLQERIQHSTFQKTVRADAISAVDLGKSFS